jgi:hypothetical protein
MPMYQSMARWLLLGSLAAVALAAPAPACARIFGTTPLTISVGPNGAGAGGPSGGPAISGDNRLARLVAFHSDAADLVPGDANGKSDVFVWQRPKGRAGLALRAPARPAGGLVRVSLTNVGGEANGDSYDASLDGSLQTRPRCVAFVSEASNLTVDDPDPAADVFVRDLRSGRTLLVSRGVQEPVSDPSIDGHCGRVTFEAGGRVLVAAVRGGRIRSLGPGADPDLARDGSALVWERNGTVMIRRKGGTAPVGPGRGPKVSDNEFQRWAVALERGGECLMEIIRGRGGVRRRFYISRGVPGGRCEVAEVSALAPTRGQQYFLTHGHSCSSYWYWNKPTGNYDDLAHSCGDPDKREEWVIRDPAASARGNFVAFSTGVADKGSSQPPVQQPPPQPQAPVQPPGSQPPQGSPCLLPLPGACPRAQASHGGIPKPMRFLGDRNGNVRDVFFKHLVDGRPL